MEIFHLVYRSTAAPDLSEHSIQDILSVARKHNEANHLTGILIYRQGNFLQLLEGDRTEVNAIYTKIKRDKRHEGVLTMIEATSEQRIIDNWTMAFVDESKASGLIGNLWSLFDSVIQKNTKDKSVIFPILKKFMGNLSKPQ